MTRKKPKRRTQFPKTRKGLILSPRIDHKGRRINRWIRLTPSARDLRNMPPSHVEVPVDQTAPRNLFAANTVTPLSSRTVEEQREWVGRAGRAGGDALVDHIKSTDPDYFERGWRGVHHEDLMRLGTEALDFVLSVEKEEGFEFEPFLIRRFVEESDIFGTHYALARIGHASAFSAFESDPEMRATLIKKARLAIPPSMHVDEDGFIRLYASEPGASE